MHMRPCRVDQMITALMITSTWVVIILPLSVSRACQTAPLVSFEYKALQHTLYVKVLREGGREGRAKVEI